MLLQTNLRLSATSPVAGAAAARALEKHDPRPVESSGSGADARSRTQGEQAAILHLAPQARDRAQAREEAEAPDSAETEGEAPARAEGSEDLSHDQQQAVDDLQQRDREVRTREQTHRSVGGQYAGNVQLEYATGPDGQRYAVSGATPINVAPVQGDPAATLRKMEVVQRAAHAPASPSGADRQVAAEAAKQAQQARSKMAHQRYGDARELAPESDEAAPSAPRHLPSVADAEALPGQLLSVLG